MTPFLNIHPTARFSACSLPAAPQQAPAVPARARLNFAPQLPIVGFGQRQRPARAARLAKLWLKIYVAQAAAGAAVGFTLPILNALGAF